MSDFSLSIERLGAARESFRFEATAAWGMQRLATDRDDVCEATEPFVFSLEACRAGEDVALEGRLEGRVALECSRCAKRYGQALREAFRLVLSPAQGRVPADPEGVRALAERGLCLGEDLEVGWFRGPVVRLDDFFGEAIALALPLQPLCREDCPGVCPHCGADRARTQCDCVEPKIDSPFAVLASLRGGERDN